MNNSGTLCMNLIAFVSMNGKAFFMVEMKLPFLNRLPSG